MNSPWEPMMFGAAFDSESARLAALRATGVLDTAPEPVYDWVVELAAIICQTPIALVSLVDEHRQWFKAARGLDDVRETPREHAFCAHAIGQHSTFLVEDASADPRFRDNPLVVGDPGIRFYAGTTLLTADGHALGTLCVIDRHPKTLTDRQRHMLEALASVVAAKIEARRDRGALEDALAELHQILDAVPTLISRRDGALRYRFVNRALAEFLGRDPAHLIGLDSADALDPEMAERSLPLIERARAGEIVRTVHSVATSDGCERTLAMCYRPIVDAKDRITGVYGFHEDVTERVAMENEIRALNAHLEARVASRTSALNDALAQIETYSRAIAHDLRAPLRQLSGFLRLAVEDTRDGDPVSAARHLDRAEAATIEMSALVNGLQRLMRLSHEPLDFVRIDLGDLVREAWRALADEPGFRRALFTVGALPGVVGDRALLKQVFVNLLGNALKFSGERDLPSIAVGSRATPQGVEVTIRDNGAGFAPEQASRLFKPFTRLHDRAQYPGTGNGLAIVERIVARHGGGVRAEAIVDGGATFTVTLPAAQDP